MADSAEVIEAREKTNDREFFRKSKNNASINRMGK